MMPADPDPLKSDNTAGATESRRQRLFSSLPMVVALSAIMTVILLLHLHLWWLVIAAIGGTVAIGTLYHAARGKVQDYGPTVANFAAREYACFNEEWNREMHRLGNKERIDAAEGLGRCYGGARAQQQQRGGGGGSPSFVFRVCVKPLLPLAVRIRNEFGAAASRSDGIDPFRVVADFSMDDADLFDQPWRRDGPFSIRQISDNPHTDEATEDESTAEGDEEVARRDSSCKVKPEEGRPTAEDQSKPRRSILRAIGRPFFKRKKPRRTEASEEGDTEMMSYKPPKLPSSSHSVITVE